MSGPNVLVTVQRPLYQELTTEASRAKLHKLAGDLEFNESDSPLEPVGRHRAHRRVGCGDKRLGKLHV